MTQSRLTCYLDLQARHHALGVLRMNIVELTDLVGRKQWIDLADIVTMHRENVDTPYAFTQMLLTNHHVVRVQERPEAIVERVRK